MTSRRRSAKLEAFFEGSPLISNSEASEALLSIFGEDILPGGVSEFLSESVAYPEFERVFLTLDALLEGGEPVSASAMATRLGEIAVEDSSEGLEETLDAVIEEQRRMKSLLSDLVDRVSKLEQILNK